MSERLKRSLLVEEPSPTGRKRLNCSNVGAVQARITIDGRLRFISTQAYQAITVGNPTSGVDVIIQPV